MLHKAFRLILLFCFTTIAVKAQNLSKSPYSFFGVGDMHFLGNATQSAMGQSTQGFRRAFEVNNGNPASYGSIRLTVIEAGFSLSGGTISNATANNAVYNASFGYLGFGVPLSQKLRWGLSFGLQPLSSSGYQVVSKVQYDGFPATQEFTGKGGLSKFYMGSGIALYKNLSVGFNAAYVFGQFSSIESFYVPQEYNKFNVERVKATYVGDLYFDFGLQYQHQLEKKRQLTFGATVSPAKGLNATRDYSARTMGVGGVLTTKDTIVFEATKSGSIDLPMMLKAGVAFEKADNWMVAADVKYAGWSDFRSFGHSDSLKNMIGFSIGGSYIPAISDYKNYFRRIEYRAGARYDNGYLNVYGTDIATFGVSAGLGLPLGKTRSRLNITGEWFKRGTIDKNLIAEQYWRIILGITFTDKWFDKTKYE